MMDPSFVAISTHDLVWYAQVLNTRDLRVPKAHLGGGGSVYAKQMTRDKTMISTIFREGGSPDPRTSEIWQALHVNGALSPKPNGLEMTMDVAHGGYVARDGSIHESIPTVAEYALVSKMLSKASTDASLLWGGNTHGLAISWMYNTEAATVKAGLFFVTQRTILRLLWTYPACQIPVAPSRISGEMAFCIMTLVEVLSFMASCAK